MSSAEEKADRSSTPKPKIYCFVNGKACGNDLSVCAIAEDGTWLAGHVSSSEWHAKHDIGMTSDWKHETYKKHYPDGYELEWVEDAKPGAHAGLDAACEKAEAKGKRDAAAG